MIDHVGNLQVNIMATQHSSETSSSVVCGAKECTGVGADLRTDDLVGADLVEVRNFRSFAFGVSHLYCTSSRQCNIGAVWDL